MEELDDLKESQEIPINSTPNKKKRIIIILIIAFIIIVLTIGLTVGLCISKSNQQRLNFVNKVFIEKEPIELKVTGSGKDWVGIFLPKSEKPIRWYYIEKVDDSKSPGSGVIHNLLDYGYDHQSDYPEYFNISCGKYVIRLIPNDEKGINKQVEYKEIEVKQQPLLAPLSLKYDIENIGSGYANGNVTVEVPKKKPYDIVIKMYWADDKGKLEGLTYLEKFKATTDIVTHEMAKGSIIPPSATRLLAYTAPLKGSLESNKYAEFILPKGAAMKHPGKPRYQFTVISDSHIKTNHSHMHNIYFRRMLNDVVNITPNSKGIFVNGDLTDSGDEIEYNNVIEMHKEVAGAPNIYIGLGNHELYSGRKDEKVAKFIKYAKKPDGTNAASTFYDFWLEGNHFVFIGNDKMVKLRDVTLLPESLKWINETIAKGYDAKKPTFIFLHQSLYNTVAGGLPGQGWHGVVKKSDPGLREVLKNYPNAIFFNGHSHWTLSSESSMFPSNGELPNIFNTGSTAYEWMNYKGEPRFKVSNSEGYIVNVYDDKVLLCGRQFSFKKWVPSALFRVDY